MSHTTNLPNLLRLPSASSKDTLILKTQCGLWAAASGNVAWSAWNPHRAPCAAAPSLHPSGRALELLLPPSW